MQRYYEDGTIPWVKSGELREAVITQTEECVTEQALAETAIKLVPAGTILLALYGATIGRLGILGIEATTNQAVCHIVPNPDIADNRYLYHALSEKVPSLIAIGAGGAQPNISQAIVKELKILLPPLPEQRRIATILDSIQLLIAKRKETLTQLESLADSIFGQMFSQQQLKECAEVELSDVAELLTGYAFRSQEYVSTLTDHVKLCRGANVLPGRIDWSDLVCWPLAKSDGFDEFELRAGDVLIAMDRPWISEGFKIALVQESDCPSLLVQRVARIRAKKSANNSFLYYLLRQPAFTNHCRPTETTVPHISPKEIRSYRFILPSKNLQDQFEERLMAIKMIVHNSHESLTQLQVLFDALQHRAFRGEL
jgi:type I restriction enzyme S subunit